MDCMNKCILFLTTVLLGSCATTQVSPRPPTEESFVDKSKAFYVDTPAAQLTQPFRFPVRHQTTISCRFDLVRRYHDDNWHPALAIAFSKLGKFGNDVAGEQHVKFSAFFTDETIGRQYEVTTWDNDKGTKTPFMRLNDSKEEITLTMAWHQDGYFSYRVAENNGTSGTAAIYRPNIAPAVATVLASGVAGYLDCKSDTQPASSTDLD